MRVNKIIKKGGRGRKGGSGGKGGEKEGDNEKGGVRREPDSSLLARSVRLGEIVGGIGRL